MEDEGAEYPLTIDPLLREQTRLTASDGAAFNNFGYSVAISGNTAVVGANNDDVGPNPDQGSAYVFFTACNTSPPLGASNQVRQKGSPAALSTIATVDDWQDPIGFLSVSVVSAPAGILITNIANSNGVITAQVAALCKAALGSNTVLLRVEDSDGATGQVTLYVNVTANTVPSLGSYADTSIVVTNSVNVTPSTPPSDNGSIVKVTADSPTFAGGQSINLHPERLCLARLS